MKKVLKLLVAIILAIVILGGVMFLVDCSRGKSGKEPVFVISEEHDNGGNIYYKGLGYIISSNMITGGVNAQIGSWVIELKEEKEIIIDDFDDEKEVIDNEKENIPSSGDIIPDIDSGELVSGDIINEDIASGEIISGDIEISDEIIDDKTENDDKLDIEILSGDDEVVQKDEYSFTAVIIGINYNNMIVQALEDEAINASSDMFSFSLNEQNSSEQTRNYLIGQKVKIEYTGVIRETYPAQIDVISIEIIE